jgi:hypothetical protein
MQVLQTGTLVTSLRGCAQILQSPGKRREKRARETDVATEGITLAFAVLLLEKTHLR